MRRFRFAIVLAVAALGFYLGFQLGFGNRFYIDLVGRYENEMARLRGILDLFVLGSFVCLFGGFAAKITKTGSVYVIASASVIVFVYFGERIGLKQLPNAISLTPHYLALLLPYFSGVFAVLGLWTFCARLSSLVFGDGNTKNNC